MIESLHVRSQFHVKPFHQPAYDIDQVLAKLEQESGLSGDQENSRALLLFLWGRRQEVEGQLKEWRMYLEEMDLPEGEDGARGLQVEPFFHLFK